MSPAKQVLYQMESERSGRQPSGSPGRGKTIQWDLVESKCANALSLLYEYYRTIQEYLRKKDCAHK